MLDVSPRQRAVAVVAVAPSFPSDEKTPSVAAVFSFKKGPVAGEEVVIAALLTR